MPIWSKRHEEPQRYNKTEFKRFNAIFFYICVLSWILSWVDTCRKITFGYFCVQASSVKSDHSSSCVFPFQKQHTHTNTYTCVSLEYTTLPPVDQEMPDLYNREKVWRHIVLSLDTHAHTHTEPTKCVLTSNKDINGNKKYYNFLILRKTTRMFKCS